MDVNKLDSIINCVEKVITVIERLYNAVKRVVTFIKLKMDERKNKIKTGLSVRLKRFNKTI